MDAVVPERRISRLEPQRLSQPASLTALRRGGEVRTSEMAVHASHVSHIYGVSTENGYGVHPTGEKSTKTQRDPTFDERVSQCVGANPIMCRYCPITTVSAGVRNRDAGYVAVALRLEDTRLLFIRRE